MSISRRQWDTLKSHYEAIGFNVHVLDPVQTYTILFLLQINPFIGRLKVNPW